MILALAPILLMLATVIISMLSYALGLTPASSEWLSPRLVSGGLGTIMLWFVSFFARHILRDEEQMRAERLARDTLLREQNPELWRTRQVHEATVKARTAEILTAMRAKPLHQRLRTYLSPADEEGR